jgi:hypothetical protein
VASVPDDDACRELLSVHSAFYGEQQPGAFCGERIANSRLVVRLQVTHLCGVIAAGGRRPVPRVTAPAG